MYSACAQLVSLCDPVDCSLPGSSVHGIFQARILEWVAFSSSRGSSWSRDWTHISWSPALQGNSLPTETSGKPLFRIPCHQIMMQFLWHNNTLSFLKIENICKCSGKNKKSLSVFLLPSNVISIFIDDQLVVWYEFLQILSIWISLWMNK